jgi:hypothetical protein
MTDKREERKEPDWDWVTAQRKCSAQASFECLLAVVRKNVATRNDFSENEKRYPRFEVKTQMATLFSVIDNFPRGDTSMTATFSLQVDGTIIVRESGAKEETAYTVKLDDDGECRLHSRGTPVDMWLIARRALDRLFF